AGQHDGALRRLMAANAMEGEVTLAFEREPSYFFGSGVQAPFHQVVVGRDAATGEVIGVGTRAIRRGFVNGEPVDVGYLGDLRLDARYRGGVLLGRAYRHLAELHRDGRARLYFTMIAEGNRRALSTIAAGRAGLPPYRELGRFLSPAVNLRGRKPPIAFDGEVVHGVPERLPEIVDCLRRNLARRQLAPVYAEGDFGGAWLRGFRVEDFHVALRGGRVVGVVGAWDQRAFKQTVVRGYAPRLTIARPFYNLAAHALGWPRYPPPGEALRSFHASFIAVDDDALDVFRALLRAVYNDRLGRGYHYFVVGLHERDPLAAALADYALTPFAGRLFVVHFEDGEEPWRRLDGRVPYVELAML
ncbi:MAG TPA: hypothetical protein VGQ78_06280, partial [Vicinamibacteria bacterium]|nr:hypothetical protein [Vicinamibacteria bacterium]